MDKNRSFPSIKGTLYHFCHYLNDNYSWVSLKLTILHQNLEVYKLFHAEVVAFS